MKSPVYASHFRAFFSPALNSCTTWWQHRECEVMELLRPWMCPVWTMDYDWTYFTYSSVFWNMFSNKCSLFKKGPSSDVIKLLNCIKVNQSYTKQPWVCCGRWWDSCLICPVLNSSSVRIYIYMSKSWRVGEVAAVTIAGIAEVVLVIWYCCISIRCLYEIIIMKQSL